MAAPTSTLLQLAESPFSTAQMWPLFLVLFATLLLADAGHIFWHAGQIDRWHQKAVSDDIPLRWARVRNRGSVGPRRPATTRVSSLAAIDRANMYLFTSQTDCIDGELQDAHFSDGRKNTARLSCNDLYHNPTACSLVPESRDKCCACKSSDASTDTSASASTTSTGSAANKADMQEGLSPQVLLWRTKVGQSSIVDIGLEELNGWVASPTPRHRRSGDLIPMMPGQLMHTVATNGARGWQENVTLIYGNGLGSQAEGGVDRRLLIAWIPYYVTSVENSTAEAVTWDERHAISRSEENVPTNRREFGFATDDGQPVGGYMYGGTPVLGSDIKFGDFWSFNFTGHADSLTWYKLADCPSDVARQGEPCARSGHTLTAIRTHSGNWRMEWSSPYLFGGDLSRNSTHTASSNQLWVYNRYDDIWERLHYGGYQPEPRAHHSAVVTSTGNLRFYGGVYEETHCFEHPVHDQGYLCGDNQHRTATSLFFCREHGYRQTSLVESASRPSDAICMVYLYEEERWAHLIDRSSVVSKICCRKSHQDARGEIFEYNTTKNEMVRIRANGFEGNTELVPLSDVPAPRSHHHAVAIPNGMLLLGGDTNSDSGTMEQEDEMFVLLDGWVLSTTFIELEVNASTTFTLQPRVFTHAVVNVVILEQFSDTNLTLVMVSPSRITWEPFTSNPVNISVTARNNIFGAHLTRLIFDTTSDDQEFNGGALNLIDLNIVVRSEDIQAVAVIPRGEISKVLRYPVCTPEACVDPEPPLVGICVPCIGRSCPECGTGMRFSGWESWPLCTPCAPGRYRNQEHVDSQSYVYDCAPCPEGSYQPLHGSDSCALCEDRDSQAGSTVCQAMQDASRPEMVAAPGWWKISDDFFVDCLNNDACLGNNTCAEGHSGPLCGACIDGWTMVTARSGCQKCTNPGMSKFLVVAYYIIRVMIIFHIMSKAVKSAFELRFVKDVVLKILTNYFLLMSRTDFQSHFGNTLGSLSTSFRSTSGGSFFTWSLACGYASFSDLPQHRLYAVIGWMTPLLGVCIAVIYACLGRKLNWLSLSGTCYDDFAMFLVVYLYSTYAYFTTYLLSSVAVYKDGRLALCADTFAYQDLSQAPWTSFADLGILVWCILTPLALMGCVFYYKRRYGLDDRRTRVRLGYLINGYERRYYYWEAYILSRALLVISIDTQMIIWPRIFSTISFIIVGIAFIVYQMQNKPFDNRFHEELDFLEKNSLSAFITTNILDAALQLCPDRVDINIIRWPYLVIVVYLNLRFLVRCALMLGHGVIPVHCLEYASQRLRAILVSNSFNYVLRKGELRFHDLMQCERDYLAMILQEIDSSFCKSASLRHMRLGGARHEVVKEAVMYYYRNLPKLGQQTGLHTSEAIVTSPTSPTSGSSDVKRGNSGSVAMAEYKEQLRLQHLRDALDIPSSITVPIDILHVEIMRQCSAVKFLQALCSEDAHTEREHVPELIEHTKDSSANSGERVRIFDREFSLSQAGENLKSYEEEVQRVHQVAWHWLEETSFGHQPPLAETRCEENWNKIFELEIFSDSDDGQDHRSKQPQFGEHWNILNAHVVLAIENQWARDHHWIPPGERNQFLRALRMQRQGVES